MEQAARVAGLPITEAVCLMPGPLMPDAHFGIGGPAGGVIATRAAGSWQERPGAPSSDSSGTVDTSAGR
jgi:RNA-splicing ligase RtcB